MESVVIADDTTSVTLHSPSRQFGDDHYAAGAFVVDLAADGLTVSRPVAMLEHTWKGLASFFEDLAASWQGWVAEKTWESIEHDLRVSAVVDDQGHVRLAFKVRNGPVPTWSAEVNGLSLDAGEQMTEVAGSVGAWVRSSES